MGASEDPMLVRTLLAAMAMALATAGVPGRVEAQCRLCTVPTTTPEAKVIAPVALQVEANLDFDRIDSHIAFGFDFLYIR